MSIRLEVAGRIGTIVLDRPPVNALDREHQWELEQAAKEAGRNPQIRAVLIRGAGDVFSAGADIREMAAMSAVELRDHAPILQRVFTAVATIPKPVCAAIEGYALGGGLELALCADFRVCTENARLGLPEIMLGVIPGAGGTQRLTRLVGPASAKLMGMTGEPVRSGDALRLGLVHKVVPVGVSTEASLSLLSKLASGPGAALAAVKQAVDAGFSPAGFQLETRLFARLSGTTDRMEGMTAFLEKRKPEFD
jgi:enoyl-CoA hydratase/carnithine racemase